MQAFEVMNSFVWRPGATVDFCWLSPLQNTVFKQCSKSFTTCWCRVCALTVCSRTEEPPSHQKKNCRLNLSIIRTEKKVQKEIIIVPTSWKKHLHNINDSSQDRKLEKHQKHARKKETYPSEKLKVTKVTKSYGNVFKALFFFQNWKVTKDFS